MVYRLKTSDSCNIGTKRCDLSFSYSMEEYRVGLATVKCSRCYDILYSFVIRCKVQVKHFKIQMINNALMSLYNTFISNLQLKCLC